VININDLLKNPYSIRTAGTVFILVTTNILLFTPLFAMFSSEVIFFKKIDQFIDVL